MFSLDRVGLDVNSRIRKIRPLVVLSVGFGGLLAFIVAAAIGTLVQLDRVRIDDTRVRQGFLGRLHSLEQIRADIYLSGTYIRDFLLSPDRSGAEAQQARINAIERETRSALEGYSHSLDPAEQAAFESLRSEIDAYWEVLQATFNWTPEERERLKYSFFYEQLVPRRTTMLQIADNIAAINQNGLNRAEDRLASSADNLRWSLIVTFGTAIGGGILLALATIGLTIRLERELELRLNETTEAQANLGELSARLVKAQEEERRTLARELHDEVGQSLSAIMMEAGSARATGDEREIQDRVASIARIAERTLNVVRDLALLLRPSMLDDFGLVPALNWHAKEMSKRTGLKIRITAGEACDDLPEEHKTCIYRLVQEALNNAARHASARSVQVSVTHAGDSVVFSVKDDGRGFDKRYVRGLGLLGMEERVRRLGGELRIESHPGRGTAISAELPLPEMSLLEHAANSDSAR
jgi:signal transduction histidine kinase